MAKKKAAPKAPVFKIKALKLPKSKSKGFKTPSIRAGRLKV
jgi:hypothetical protein